ncbi:hypothetical protein EDF57_103562 [Novosphingobium sp. PhB55]|uniref:hypothetical protein n=1 Tax=Novosphingobium sp. PhB55 TaxID=2485106 RepID=UPI001066D984|nr:hypothetical protein [Novosphingobium sp. PhB55]TDW65378.1 hypothetical protein EDF57_103562 [Novosphingobium sp. PhB55]
MNRSSLPFVGIIAATLAVGTGLLYALDDGARLINENAAARAFILSDLFWPAVVGLICVMLILLVGVVSSYEFHPDRLSGRNVPERGE